MTLEQKAIKIAKFDGRLRNELLYTVEDPIIQRITEEYLTNLNYLIPVANKAYNHLIYRGQFKAKILLSDVLQRLNKDRTGCYTLLFDEIYTAITILEN